MRERPCWIKKIENAWKRRPIVWLSGVRRVGKTTLAKMFQKAVYVNCDLPSSIRRLEDPESFYDALGKGSLVIFDEIHRLDDPSMVLKIASDEYPHLKILATGSSTLSATQKFRDTLTGRKQMIYLSPVLWSECQTDFNIKDVDRRMLSGGLPEVLLSEVRDPSFFSEWLDSYYARDIQELFAIRNRSGFMKLLQLLIRQSGSLVDYSNLSKLSGLSRPTVKAHTEAISIAHAGYFLSPFYGGKRREITKRPKFYAFDTGFVAFVKGWDTIREDDRGLLWEHMVLDELRSRFDSRNIFYWRDKSGREIDFIIPGKRKQIDIVECKINPDSLNIKNLLEFRSIYPEGRNYIVSPFIKTPYRQKIGKLNLYYYGLPIGTLGNDKI